MHVALPKLPINYSKPVMQCKREALRGYCQWYVSRPSIYTYVVTLPFDVERPSIITLSYTDYIFLLAGKIMPGIHV